MPAWRGLLQEVHGFLLEARRRTGAHGAALALQSHKTGGALDGGAVRDGKWSLSKSHVQICISFEVGVCVPCSVGCELFCSKRPCNYPDNEVYHHVDLKVLLAFKTSGVASKGNKQSRSNFHVSMCIACSVGCALFCSKRPCNYADNEVYHVVYEVVSLREGEWSCVKIPRPDL